MDLKDQVNYNKYVRNRLRDVGEQFSTDWFPELYPNCELLDSESSTPVEYDRDSCGILFWDETRKLRYVIKWIETEEVEEEDVLTWDRPVPEYSEAGEEIAYLRYARDVKLWSSEEQIDRRELKPY